MIIRLAVASVVVAALVAASVALASHRTRAAAQPFSGKLTYHETKSPASGKGVVGQGAFSGKLGGRVLMAAAVAELVTGVPTTAMAKGGTWVARYDIDAANNYKGIVVTTFKSPGLGSLCLAGTTKHGKFTSGFIPASGTLTALGGTGQSAKVRLAATFKQTAITGSDTETFGGTGAFKTLAMGAAKPMTSACKAVAKLKS